MSVCDWCGEPGLLLATSEGLYHAGCVGSATQTNRWVRRAMPESDARIEQLQNSLVAAEVKRDAAEVRADQCQELADELAGLAGYFAGHLDRIIDIHAAVVMDTEPERALHGRAVAEMREAARKGWEQLNHLLPQTQINRSGSE